MMRPSRLSASYASLLPALNRLGYRADVREASVYGSRCMVVVSGAPTTRVLNDGSWERDDGIPVGVILDAAEHDGGLAVSYRRVKGVPEDTVIDDWMARAKAAPALLEEIA